MEPVVLARGGSAPDFVPLWAQVLIVVLAFAVLALAWHRRDRRNRP
ncbi:hypothetical protein [Streptomyces sp. NPDC046939]